MLVKESEVIEIVTEDMIDSLNHVAQMTGNHPEQNTKIHMIKALRIASKIKYGKTFGLRDCKIFVETHFNFN